MRKTISIIAVFMAIIMCFPFTVNAEDKTEWQDTNISDEEFYALEHSDGECGPVNTRASGLIMGKSLSIAKSGTTLYIKGYTEGIPSVVKAGFTEVIIQRKTSSSSTWSNYKTYTDLYYDNNFYSLGKSLTVATGYQYRATCVHYAKKSLFSTEKIANSTGYLTF